MLESEYLSTTTTTPPYRQYHPMANDQTQLTWNMYKENRNKRSTPFMHNELPASIQAEGAYIHEMTRDITEATKQRRTCMDQGIKSKTVYSKHRCPCWYPSS